MPAEQQSLRTLADRAPDTSNPTTRFLKRALTELTVLEGEAPKHYHGVLCSLLAAARQETEMLLREERASRKHSLSRVNRHVFGSGDGTRHEQMTPLQKARSP